MLPRDGRAAPARRAADLEAVLQWRPPTSRSRSRSTSPAPLSSSSDDPASSSSDDDGASDGVDPNALYCVCRQPYDPERPMVGCDECDGWFHFECVGLVPPGEMGDGVAAEAAAPERYRCAACCARAGRRFPQALDGRGTGVALDSRCLLHRPPKLHPEQPDRIEKTVERLRARQVLQRCRWIPGRPASDAELQRVHSPAHLRRIRQGQVLPLGEADPPEAAAPPTPAAGAVARTQSARVRLELTSDQKAHYGCSPQGKAEAPTAQCVPVRPRDVDGADDVPFSRGTEKAARVAAGSSIEATQWVMEGKVANAVALVRPPGHHADRCHCTGFCYYNNVACAAKAALQMGAQRVMILDWDVHHGNGIADVFYADPRVLYVSIHRLEPGYYPETGEPGEVGAGAGLGFNVNVGLRGKGMGNVDYLAIFERIVQPLGREFAPDVVLVAAGFDCARGDPLGEMNVTPPGFAHMVARLQLHVSRRIVVVLEGGYDSANIAKGLQQVLVALQLHALPKIRAATESSCLLVEEATRAAIRETTLAHRPYWASLRDLPRSAMMATGRMLPDDFVGATHAGFTRMQEEADADWEAAAGANGRRAGRKRKAATPLAGPVIQLSSGDEGLAGYAAALPGGVSAAQLLRLQQQKQVEEASAAQARQLTALGLDLVTPSAAPGGIVGAAKAAQAAAQHSAALPLLSSHQAWSGQVRQQGEAKAQQQQQAAASAALPALAGPNRAGLQASYLSQSRDLAAALQQQQQQTAALRKMLLETSQLAGQVGAQTSNPMRAAQVMQQQQQMELSRQLEATQAQLSAQFNALQQQVRLQVRQQTQAQVFSGSSGYLAQQVSQLQRQVPAGPQAYSAQRLLQQAATPPALLQSLAGHLQRPTAPASRPPAAMPAPGKAAATPSAAPGPLEKVGAAGGAQDEALLQLRREKATHAQTALQQALAAGLDWSQLDPQLQAALLHGGQQISAQTSAQLQQSKARAQARTQQLIAQLQAQTQPAASPAAPAGLAAGSHPAGPPGNLMALLSSSSQTTRNADSKLLQIIRDMEKQVAGDAPK